MVDDPLHRRIDQGFGFLGSFLPIIGYPRVMLTNISHLEQIWVQSGSLACGAEGLLVHVGGARGNDYPRQAFLFDVCFDELLPQTGAHELVVAGNRHLVLHFYPASDLFHVYSFGDVGAAMAYIYPNFFTHRFLSSSEF